MSKHAHIQVKTGSLTGWIYRYTVYRYTQNLVFLFPVCLVSLGWFATHLIPEMQIMQPSVEYDWNNTGEYNEGGYTSTETSDSDTYRIVTLRLWLHGLFFLLSCWGGLNADLGCHYLSCRDKEIIAGLREWGGGVNC